MPRQTVWMNQQQLDEVRETFGAGVNLSGVVRAGLAVLLDVTNRDGAGRVRALVQDLGDVAEMRGRVEAELHELRRSMRSGRRSS